MEEEFFLEAVIDRFEGKYAVLKTKTGDEIDWPQDKLPEDSAEGEVIFLQALGGKEKEEEREKLAKTILNEILNTKKDV